MKKQITVYDVKHAINCIFENNLLAEFEEEIATIEEDESLGEVIKKNNICLHKLVLFLNRHSDIEEYVISKNWLDIICEENKTTIYEIARKSECDKSKLFKIIKNNIKFNNISLSTIQSISKGLDMKIAEFIDKYFDRFFEK